MEALWNAVTEKINPNVRTTHFSKNMFTCYENKFAEASTFTLDHLLLLIALLSLSKIANKSDSLKLLKVKKKNHVKYSIGKELGIIHVKVSRYSLSQTYALLVYISHTNGKSVNFRISQLYFPNILYCVFYKQNMNHIHLKLIFTTNSV